MVILANQEWRKKEKLTCREKNLEDVLNQGSRCQCRCILYHRVHRRKLRENLVA